MSCRCEPKRDIRISRTVFRRPYICRKSLHALGNEIKQLSSINPAHLCLHYEKPRKGKTKTRKTSRRHASIKEKIRDFRTHKKAFPILRKTRRSNWFFPNCRQLEILANPSRYSTGGNRIRPGFRIDPKRLVKIRTIRSICQE